MFVFSFFPPVILLLYFPIALSAFFVYGDELKDKDNIIESLGGSTFTLLAKVSMAIHLILAFLIIINPVSQDLEEIFKVPNSKLSFNFSNLNEVEILIQQDETTVENFFKTKLHP